MEKKAFVTKEMIEKIAENLSLTPSDKETAELWSGEPQEEATGGTDEVYKVDEKDGTITLSDLVDGYIREQRFVRISMMMMINIPASLSSWTAFPSRITLTDFRQWMTSATRWTTASISMQTVRSRMMCAHGTPVATA